jgi:hypothetical protein
MRSNPCDIDLLGSSPCDLSRAIVKSVLEHVVAEEVIDDGLCVCPVDILEDDLRRVV